MSPVIYYFFSKYSPACQQLTQTMRQMAGHFRIIPVDIDDVHIRRKLLSTPIQQVPACVVEGQTSVDIFTGHELQSLIQQLQQSIYQQAPQAPQPPQVYQPPPQTTIAYTPPPQQPLQQPVQQASIPVTSIVNPALVQQAPTAKQNMNDTYNARLQPTQVSGVPVQVPVLTTQIANGQQSITQQGAQMAQQAQQLQQTTLPPPQAQQAQPESTQTFTVIDEGALTAQPNPNVFSGSQGMSMQELTGTNSLSRMGAKGNAIAEAQMMQQMREAEDVGTNPQRGNAMAMAAQLQQGR